MTLDSLSDYAVDLAGTHTLMVLVLYLFIKWGPRIIALSFGILKRDRQYVHSC